MISQKEHKEEMFLQSYLHGDEHLLPENGSKEFWIKTFGKDFVRSRSEKKPAKGLWNFVKRLLGTGGYK